MIKWIPIKMEINYKCGFEVLNAMAMEFAVFCVVTPFSSGKSDVSEEHNAWACSPFLLFFCLAYSSALNLEAVYSSKTSAGLQTTRRYNPEDRTHH
jgi:hypothetical protein